MESLQQHIEALIFSSDRPVEIGELMEVLTKLSDSFIQSSEVTKLLDQLQEKYAQPDYAFELTQSGGGYQFLTKSVYHDTVALHIAQRSRHRLSTAALETLAIIAYKQPVTKGEIEKVRGVNCDYTLQRLLEKELIVIKGRDSGPGRPILYETSESFMDYFGINSVDDLPKLKDIKEDEGSSIGLPEAASQPSEVDPSHN
jgi:segregation and condensation protein B